MKVRAVGVDLGGTWLRVCAFDDRGRLAREVRRPAPPPEGLSRALRPLWKAWKIDRVPVLVAGSKGVWKELPRRAMSEALHPLAEEVRVTSDVELAHRAALGEGPGLLILAGTGSIALGKDAKGRWIRAGGLGPKKGDEGSGFWIGREFLKRTGKEPPASTPRGVRQTAGAAEKVLARAARDPLCAAILREAQGHLVELLRELLEKQDPGRNVRVGWGGGLFENEKFRGDFFRKLRRAAPDKRFRAAAPRLPAARVAARWAFDLWRAGGSPAILERAPGEK